MGTFGRVSVGPISLADTVCADCGISAVSKHITLGRGVGGGGQEHINNYQIPCMNVVIIVEIFTLFKYAIGANN